MSPKERPAESRRDWMMGVIVVVAIVVSFVGFARVSIGWTLAISTAICAALLIFLWSVGRRKQR